MGVSIGTGLTSGIDYTTLISSLMEIEAKPQTLLKTQLTDAQTDAAAYRSINTAFAALATSASALTGTNFTAARTASSTSSAVTATAGSTAVVGSSVSFTVKSLAAAHSVLSSNRWTSATAAMSTSVEGSGTAPTWPMTIVNTKTGATMGTIDIPANSSLTDAAAAINSGGFGLTATVVQQEPGLFRLQVARTDTGVAGDFYLVGANEDSTTAGTGFTVASQGADAKLSLDSGIEATSPSNTFSELMTGVSVTVSATSTSSTTISVKNDTSALTAKVQALVTAANNVLSTIKTNTDSSTGSKAALKGNFGMNSLANSLLNQVSSAVGSDGSAAKAGLQLTQDGLLTFDATAFQTALTADPALVQRIFSGTTGAGKDNVRGTADDSLDTDGIGARLQRLAQQANDSVTGTLTTLANGQDTRAKALQKQIDSWTTRLADREAALTTQYNALEVALGTLKNQSTWLTSQIASLPSWSSSDS